jgi:SHS2 domain-containing protein
MANGWETFDHTGDLGLEVWADSPSELYATAALALAAQIARAGEASDQVVWRAVLEGDDAADLLVHWLNTVLLEGETRHAVWTSAEVTDWTPTRLEARLAGSQRDRARHEFLREVKAVSYHDLSLDLERRPCRCRLILDL